MSLPTQGFCQSKVSRLLFNPPFCLRCSGSQGELSLFLNYVCRHLLCGYSRLGSGAWEGREGIDLLKLAVVISPEWVGLLPQQHVDCRATSSLPDFQVELSSPPLQRKCFRVKKRPLYSLPSSSCRKPTHSSVELSEFLSRCS